MKLSIILPTYNEAGNLVKLIPKTKKEFPKAEIIVVDDSSPDKTAEIAKKLKAKVILRKQKDGIGAAIKEGFDSAKGDILVSMDADCSINVKDIHRLLEKLQTNDIVVGSKYSRYSKAEGFSSAKQKIISRLGNKVITRLFKLPVDDVTLNFRALSKGTWQKLNLNEKTNVFFLEMLINAKSKKMKICQIPINFSKRVYGKSKTELSKLILLYSNYILKEIF
jgi:dolichol-phosphate mannosyltransferase